MTVFSTTRAKELYEAFESLDNIILPEDQNEKFPLHSGEKAIYKIIATYEEAMRRSSICSYRFVKTVQKNKKLDKYEYLNVNPLNIILFDKDDHKKLGKAAFLGKLDLVKYLIEEKHIDPEHTDFYGANALWYAAESGSLDLVKYLIEEKSLIPEDSILFVAAESGNIDLVKYLIEEKSFIPHNSILSPAAESGSLDIVKYLIEEKSLVLNDGILNSAAESGSLDLVKYLIDEQHLNPHTTDDDGKNALHFATQSGNLELVKYLIEEKLLVLNDTFFDSAEEIGSLDIVKYLIEEKHLPHDWISLFVAKLLNLDIVKYLIDKKHIVPNNKFLNYAAINHNLDIVKYSIDEKHLVPDNSTLANATISDSLDIVKYLVEEKKLSPNLFESYGTFNQEIRHYINKKKCEKIGKIALGALVGLGATLTTALYFSNKMN